MSVIHVLADGTRTTDITGHVVKVDSARTVYQLIARINQQNRPRKNRIEKNRRFLDE